MIKGIFGLLMLVSVVGCGPLPPEVHCDRRTEIEDICLVDNGPYELTTEIMDVWYRHTIDCAGEYFPPPKWIEFKEHESLGVQGYAFFGDEHIEVNYSRNTSPFSVLDIYAHELIHLYLWNTRHYRGHDSPLFDKCAPGTL